MLRFQSPKVGIFLIPFVAMNVRLIGLLTVDGLVMVSEEPQDLRAFFSPNFFIFLLTLAELLVQVVVHLSMPWRRRTMNFLAIFFSFSRLKSSVESRREVALSLSAPADPDRCAASTDDPLVALV